MDLLAVHIGTVLAAEIDKLDPHRRFYDKSVVSADLAVFQLDIANVIPSDQDMSPVYLLFLCKGVIDGSNKFCVRITLFDNFQAWLACIREFNH
jgi:hypothetical protein